MTFLRSFIALSALVLLMSGSNAYAAVVFAENFDLLTSADIRLDNDVTLGGSTSNANHRDIGFGEFAAGTAGDNGTIVSGGLLLDSFNNVRGAGVILDPNLFAVSGAGDYLLTFDVTSFESIPGTGAVSLYHGSGYNLAPALSTIGARLIMDLAQPVGTAVEVRGSAGGVGTQIVPDTPFSATGSQSVAFSYDGTSAVGLIFSSSGGPQIGIDNVVIATAVPEPGSMLALSLLGGTVAAVRRRHKRSV